MPYTFLIGSVRFDGKSLVALVIMVSVFEALISSPRKPKSFQNFLSHQILRHMHEALNIDSEIQKSFTSKQGLNLSKWDVLLQ